MSADLQATVRNHPLWYHTLDLGSGVVTPGWFDLRPIVNLLPWPDVRGKRCLDVGTYDGFLAFELEKRGASEVVATDISDHTQWDWPVAMRARGPDVLAQIAGPEKGGGFRIAKEALGSSVERLELSVYDLSPDKIGTFDVVVCGSLMLHLRDPLRALAAIRSVCSDRFMSIEAIDLPLTVAHPRRPVQRIDGVGGQVHWTLPNVAAHKQMVRASGFEIERSTGAYSEPYGPSHPKGGGGIVELGKAALQRVMTKRTGVPHAAVLARVS